jgi:hypothetical protein
MFKSTEQLLLKINELEVANDSKKNEIEKLNSIIELHEQEHYN